MQKVAHSQGNPASVKIIKRDRNSPSFELISIHADQHCCIENDRSFSANAINEISTLIRYMPRNEALEAG